MGIFSKKQNANPIQQNDVAQLDMARMVLNSVKDGILIVDKSSIIKMINPAAVTMTGCENANNAVGLKINSILKFENGEGRSIEDHENKVMQALEKNESLTTREYILVTMQEQKTPIAISVTPTGGNSSDRIVIFRDIAKELEEEGEQTEFISTASHEMRTPVASIEGYLGLALNPQTASIDERARKYLEEAHLASKHLGKLFQDLLDVTKLDDHKLKVHLVPAELNSLVRTIASGHAQAMEAKKLAFSFGALDANKSAKTLEQLVYSAVDVDFLREILDNLLENAIKYTPAGGAIWVGVRGDGDRVLINVTDTGMGISPDDLGHIFQKFYRVDNSQTRTIGGTGLGLYLVKQRAEAMGGKVWAESAFSEGSTFFVTLPRLSQQEYEKRKMILMNEDVMVQKPTQPVAQPQQPIVNKPSTEAQPVTSTPVTTPAPTLQIPTPAPQAPAPTPTPQTIAPTPAPQAPAPTPASQTNLTTVSL